MKQEFTETGSNFSPFHQGYLEALRAIVACDNDLANARINKTRNLLQQADGAPEIAAIQKEVAPVLNSLHGDLHYKGPASPWIKDRALVSMIGKHLATLGTDKDMANYGLFVEKTAQAFNRPYSVPSSALRA